MSDAIPEAAIAQHIAVLGKTGSGKSCAIKAALVEPLLEAGRRVCIIDPTSAWWGLRSSRDGTSAGFPILVLGGDHGDLPLPAFGGAAVARLLVEQGVNLVADTMHLTNGERTRWMIDFAGTLYRINKHPLHLIIDEAHNFAPKGKIPDPEVGLMLHATNTLASGGRSRGIRLTMITQRPQKLHNDTLTCADTLIAMRVLAPADRLAVEDWIKGCGDIEQGKTVLKSLANLQRGEGWVWYPEGGSLERLKFPDFLTFDSSATPVYGKDTPAPKRLADIDMTEIKSMLADAVSEAARNDPKLLRQRIAELERDKAARPKVADANPTAIRDAQDLGYRLGHHDALQTVDVMCGKLGDVWNRVNAAAGDVQEFICKVGELISASKSAPEFINRIHFGGEPDARSRAQMAKAIAAGVRAVDAPYRSPVQHDRPAAPLRERESTDNPGVIGKGGLRKIMTALAQCPDGLSDKQISMRSGLSCKSGSFGVYLGKARSSGWVTGERERLQITDAGYAALGDYEPAPSGADLLAMWYVRLGDGGASRLLRAVVAAYPNTITAEEAAEQSVLSATSGSFGVYLGKVRTWQLVSGPRTALKANDELFAGG